VEIAIATFGGHLVVVDMEAACGRRLWLCHKRSLPTGSPCRLVGNCEQFSFSQCFLTIGFSQENRIQFTNIKKTKEKSRPKAAWVSNQAD
jgi:hypothetical protein